MTLKLKDINFNIAMYGTEPVVQSTYSVVYTGDESSVKVNFNVTDETDLTGATAKVHLYFADSSHIEKDAQIDGTVVHYTLKGTENDHAGPVRVDVFITLNGATYTRAGYKFRIDQSLEASAPLVEYAIETLDTVIEGADEWLAQAQTDFGTAQNQRAAEWVSDNDTRDDQFNAAQASRTESFGQSETARTDAFNTSETGRSNTFTTNENARQAAADANETARNNSYTVAENDREERYGIAESNRSATADADHTRAVGDHNTATDDHGIAESDHVTATADHENYAGLLEDGIMTTQIVDKLTELETTYAPDLFTVKQQLEHKLTLQDLRSDVGFSDINKNISLIDQTMLSTTLLGQIAGTTPINATIADKSITTSKLAENSVDINTLASTVYNEFSGWEIYQRNEVTSNPLYFAFQYDLTNVAGLVNGDVVTFEYELITDDENAETAYSKLFANNTDDVAVITGGLLDADNTGVQQIKQGGLTKVKSVFVKKYDNTQKYYKPYVNVEVTDHFKNTLYYVKNPKLTIGTTVINVDPKNGFFVTKPGIYFKKGVFRPDHSLVNYALLKDKINPLLSGSSGRWKGKKVNILGDSIVNGAWQNNGVWETVTPFQEHMNDSIGFLEVRSYGVNGTRIASISTDDNQSMSVRYSGMNNDADLIIVFGGTNDFGTPTPIGTFADRTTTTFYGALHVLMEGLTKKYLGKTIIFMTPLRRVNDTVPNGQGKTLKDYSNMIKEVAEYYAITVIDTFAIGGMPPHVPEVKQAYIEDGLHPNADGHELLGTRLVPVLNAI